MCAPDSAINSSPGWVWLEQREQVALRAAGDQQPGFLAEDLRRACFQRVDARVLAIDVVADLRRRAWRRASPGWAG